MKLNWKLCEQVRRRGLQTLLFLFLAATSASAYEELGQAKEQTTQDSLKAVQSMKAQIEAYMRKNEWEKAGELIKELADKSGDVKDIYAYAVFCQRQKRLDEAEKYYNLVLTSYRALPQEKSQEYESVVANTLNKLANLHLYNRRLGEAESMYKESLEILKRLAASDPAAIESDLAQTLNDLALTYCLAQRFSEAEPMLKEALEIRRRLAISNPSAYESDLAQTLSNMGFLYGKTQRLNEAESMYKESLEIRRRLAAANPSAYESDLAQTLSNLAILYTKTQRYSDLEAVLKEGVEIYSRLAADNPSVYAPGLIQTLNNLAYIYNNTKRYSYLVNVFKDILEICRRLGETGPKFVETLGNLSYYEILLRKYAESEQYAREGLAKDSTQHWIETNLAAALLFQGKYAEAEQMYRQYKSEMKETFLGDLKAFSEAGVIPKEYEADVEKIKKMLNEE